MRSPVMRLMKGNSRRARRNIGGMNDNVQQETQRVDQDVPLATFELLARVVARRIEPSPPFCVPFAFCEFSNNQGSHHTVLQGHNRFIAHAAMAC